MSSPYTYDNAVRIHDLAIWNWLRTLLVHYPEIENPVDPAKKILEKKSHPIITVKASPDRAYAAIVDTLVHQNWIPETSGQALRDLAKSNLAVLPLPAFSWQRSDPRPDPELANVPFYWRKGFYDCALKRWVYYRWPKHWLTDYTITFWANREFSKAFFIEWIESQFGNVGAGIRETFVSVFHKEPFGEIKSRLQLTGDLQDTSELEGEEARYVRSEFTVTLRTWITMPALDPAQIPGAGGPDGINTPCGSGDASGIGAPIFVVQKDYVFEGDSESHPPEIFQTFDLFEGATAGIPPEKMCKLWPKSEGASISTSDGKQSFDITADDKDYVELFGIPVDLDEYGRALVGFSFNYTSDGPMLFELYSVNSQVEGDVPITVASFALPEAPNGSTFHHFMLTNEDVVFGRFIGDDPTRATSIHLSDLDLRLVRTLTPIIIPSLVPAGAENRYEIYNLTRRPYLVVLRVNSTGGGTMNVRLENDVTAPTFTRSLDVDKAKASEGVVLMNEPVSNTLVLVVPSGMVVDQVYAQPYNGHFHGNEV